MEMEGVCGLLSRLVHISIMYGIVMDETHHVLPCVAFAELHRVCQQAAFAVRHSGRCPPYRLQLEVRRRLHLVFCMLG